jgi:genome maintenance exonuclease 1
MMKNFNHVGSYEFAELITETINKKRHYVVGDKKYPSVTTVTGSLPSKVKGLNDWRKKVGVKEANKISTKASAKGTAVHKLVEEYLNNSFESKFSNPLAIESFRIIQPVLDRYIDNIHSQEVPLWSDHLKLAGRVDCIAEFDGMLSVIDFKTSLKEKKKEWIPDYFMQSCAYSIMWEERTKIPITQLVVIIAPQEGKPQVFLEHRDKWVNPLRKQISHFYTRNVNGY